MKKERDTMNRWAVCVLLATLLVSGCGQKNDFQSNEQETKEFLAAVDETDKEFSELNKAITNYRIPEFQMNERNLVMFQNGNNKVVFVGESLVENDTSSEAYFALKAVGDFSEVPEIKDIRLRIISSNGDQINSSLVYVYELVEQKEKYYIFHAIIQKGDAIARLDYGLTEGEYESLSISGDPKPPIKIGGIEQFPVDAVTLEEPLHLKGKDFDLSLLGYGPHFDRDGLLQDAELFDFTIHSQKDAEMKIRLEWPGLEELNNTATINVFSGIDKDIPDFKLPMNERNSIYNAVVKISVSLDNDEPATFYIDLNSKKMVEETAPSILIHEAAIIEPM